MKINTKTLSIREELHMLGVAFLATTLVCMSFYGLYALGQEPSYETLTVNVQEAMTFTTGVSGFGNLTPGTPRYATTTTHVTTNSTNGFNLKLYGDDQGILASSSVMDLLTDSTVDILDQAEWIAGGSTSTAGTNNELIGALDSSGDVLAFRMMTASGSSDVISTTWWGANDTVGSALWSGIASSTDTSQIGNTAEYSSSRRDNTIQYYLDVTAAQQTGAYDGAVTYTATANP